VASGFSGEILLSLSYLPRGKKFWSALNPLGSSGLETLELDGLTRLLDELINSGADTLRPTLNWEIVAGSVSCSLNVTLDAWMK